MAVDVSRDPRDAASRRMHAWPVPGYCIPPLIAHEERLAPSATDNEDDDDGEEE